MIKPKTSKLKVILTSASLTSLCLAPINAMAQIYTTTGGQLINDKTGWTTGAPPAAAAQAPSAGDTLKFGAGGNIIGFIAGTSSNPAASVGFGNTFIIDSTAAAGCTLKITDTNSYTISSITTPANSFAVGFTAAGALSVTNTQNAISSIQFAGNAATVTLGTGDVTGNIDSAGSSAGTLVINDTTTVSGTIGAANALTAIQIGGSGNLILGDTSKAGTLLYTSNGGQVIVGAQSFIGNVNFNGKIATLSINGGGIGGNITTTNSGAVILLNGGDAGISGTVNAGAGSAVTVQFSGDHTLTISGNLAKIGNTINNSGIGTIKLSSNVGAAFIGSAGSSLNNLKAFLWDDGTPQPLTLNNCEIHAINISGTNAGSSITVSGSSIIDGIISNAATSINIGQTLTLTGNSTAYNSTIDGAGMASRGTLVIDGNVLINANIGSIYPLTSINITSNGALSTIHSIQADILQFTGNGQVSTSSNFISNVDFAGTSGSFSLAGGTGQISGDVDNSISSGGTIVLTGLAGNIIGNFGATNAVGIQFVGDYNLQISGAIAKISGTINTAGQGTVQLASNAGVAFSGTVGTKTNNINNFLWDDGNAQTLTLSGGEIHAITINGNTAASNILVTDSSILDGAIGTNATTVINGGQTLTLTGNATIYNSTIDGPGNLAIGGVVALNKAVGGGTPLGAVNIADNGVLTFGNTLQAAQILYIGTGSIDIGTSVYTGDVNFNGNNGALIMDGVSKVTGSISSGGDSFGVITRKSGNTGVIGGAGARINTLNLGSNGNTTISGNIYAKNVNIIGGITTANFNIGDPNNFATVNISSGATLNGGSTSIYGTVQGAGTYHTLNNNYIPQLGSSGNSLGTLIVDGSQGTKYSLSGASYVSTLTINSGITLAPISAPQLTGNLVLAPSSTLDLSNNTYTVNGNVSATGSGSVAVNTVITRGSYGLLNGQLAASSIDMQGRDLVLNIDNSNITFSYDTIIPIFSGSLVNAASSNILNFTQTNSNNHYSFDGNNLIIAVDHAVVVQAVSQAAASLTPEQTASIGDAGTVNQTIAILNELNNNLSLQTGDAAAFLDEVNNSILNGNVNGLKALANVTEDTYQQTSNTNQFVEQSAITIIKDYLSTSMTPTVEEYSAEDSQQTPEGISSGSEEGRAKHSVWLQGFGNRVSQKMYKGHTGFRSRSMGWVIGTDTFVNEKIRVGAAVTSSTGKIKMKNNKTGDSTLSKSVIISLFTSYKIDHNWLLNAVVTMGNNNILANAQKFSASTGARLGISKGRYSSQSYSLDLGLGYHYKLLRNVTFSPELGVKANVSNDVGYKEQGVFAQDRTLMKRYAANYQGSIGASLTSCFKLASANISAGIHAKLMQQLAGKNPAVSTKLDGQFSATVTKNKPTSQRSYNIGVNLGINSGMLEYGSSFDIGMASKYKAYSGTLKVKVNF